MECFFGIRHAFGAINFRGNLFDTLFVRHFQIIEIVEVFFFLGDGSDFFGQFDGPLAAFEPMVGNRRFGAVFFGDAANELEFGVGVGIEFVDADNGTDTGFANDVNMGDEVFAAFFKQGQVFLCVFRCQRLAGLSWVFPTA